MNPAYERPRVELTASSQDPTKTKTIRREYARRMRGAFTRIRAAISRAIIEDDIFGLRESDEPTPEALQLLQSASHKSHYDKRSKHLRASLNATIRHELTAVEGPPDLSTLPDGEITDRFGEWLDEAQESEVMELIERDENRYIRRSYERGVDDADINLRKAGLEIPQAEAAAIMSAPVHERKLQIIFSKNFAELDGITNETSRRLQRILADGLGEGLNPREMARRMRDEIGSFQNGKATGMLARCNTLARDQVISTHAEASLERYKQQGVEQIGLKPEAHVSTAGDELVCSECAEVAQGGPYTIEELESDSSIRPAIHPNCRCTVVPITTREAAAAYSEHTEEFLHLFGQGAFKRPGRYELLANADRDGAKELVAQYSAGQSVAV